MHIHWHWTIKDLKTQGPTAGDKSKLYTNYNVENKKEKGERTSRSEIINKGKQNGHLHVVTLSRFVKSNYICLLGKSTSVIS